MAGGVIHPVKTWLGIHSPSSRNQSGLFVGHDPTTSRVEKCSKSHESSRARSSIFQVSRVGPGRVKIVLESHGSGRVGSTFFQISRVRSGRVGSRGDEKLTVRVRSRPARNGSLVGRATMTHESFSADPRVGPTRPTRGSDTSKISRFLPKGFSRINTECHSFGITIKI